MAKIIPIVLLHGALGCKKQLQPLKELLEQQGRQVISLDFSGHGGRPLPETKFGIETFATDLISFLDANHIHQADVFGYSMGGYVAIWASHIHPLRVRNMVTLGTKFDWDPASAEREVKKMNPEKIVEKVPAFARLLEARHAPVSWKELMNETAQMMTALGQKPLLTESVMKSVSNEVTILLGDQDDMADREYSQRVARWIRNAQFVLLADTPHPIEKVNLSVLLPYLLKK